MTPNLSYTLFVVENYKANCVIIIRNNTMHNLCNAQIYFQMIIRTKEKKTKFKKWYYEVSQGFFVSVFLSKF
jgi:hypothetical protein